MTYEQKLEAVKAEIVKVMPELKDLKIGTICKGKNSNEDFVYLGHNFWQAVRNGNVRLHETEAGCPVFESSVITLEYVLYACRKKAIWLICEGDGYLRGNNRLQGAVWRFNQALHFQTEEVIEFLYKILC